MAEFVAGYAQILQSKDISAFEVSERHKHLVSLMYFAQQFTWSAILDFHGAVLLEIEWGDSFMHLESRTLYGHRLPDKTAKPPVKSSHPSLLLRCQFYFVGIINETRATMPVIITVTSVVNASG